MKINGRELKGPNTEILVLPRPEADVVFKAQAIMSWDEFNKLCPKPEPPQITVKGGGVKYDVKDRRYLTSLEQYVEARHAYMVIKSLEPSKIEWTKINLSDPNSWRLLPEELAEAGFCQTEVNRIYNLAFAVNGLDEAKMEEARARFFASQEGKQPSESEFQAVAQDFTQNGEPANASG